MNELEVVEKMQGNENVPVIDSREIAKMVGMRHDNLCRNIQHYIDVIGKNSKLSSSNFFIPTTYKQAGNGKEVTRYDVTRKGCEMIANKLTGDKGILFTAEYVTRFNDMEKAITKKLSSLDMLEMSVKVMRELSERQSQTESKINDVSDKVTKLESDLKPKAEYTERVLKNPVAITSTAIAKEYGLTAVKFNKLLCKLGVQYKSGGTWFLSKKYQDKGYHTIVTPDNEYAKPYMKWTPIGRMFLHSVLKRNGYESVNEQYYTARSMQGTV